MTKKAKRPAREAVADTGAQVRITALPLRQTGATQLPCRLLAEQETVPCSPN